MSHDATNWAIQRRGLKPTTKIVLWHLCDRFNPRRWIAQLVASWLMAQPSALGGRGW